MSEWQPIETAPKDGTKILVFTCHEDIELSDWYQLWQDVYLPVEGTDLFRKERRLSHEGWNSNWFTHWMPLPNPPLHKGRE